MNAREHDYLVPDGTGVQDIKQTLAARQHLKEEAPRTLTRRFYDTFDWRVFAAGGCVWERIDGDQHQLLWASLSAQGAKRVQELDGAPGFADQLPPGPVRDQIAPLTGIRRLLPVIEVLSQVQTLRLLNEDEKTVVRIEVAENRFEERTRGRQGALATRIRVRPVRGYPEPYREIVALFEQELGLTTAHNPLLLEALAAAGRTPGDYSSKLDFRLDPDRRADATAKEILLHLLNTIEVNIPGTKANLDSEFLHDLRVAVRRTRSALSQIKGVFAPEIVQEYKERFAWLGQITGPVRDLDVYLLDFEDYRQSLPAALRPHLEPLREFLLAHYDLEQKRLANHLESQRLQDLIKDWRAFLEAPVPERSALPNAMRATRSVADARIWRMYKRVLREGRGIGPDSPSEDLHELRKSCKKLRYLLEFFASLYPKKDMRTLIRILKQLLDNLGRFQDFAVQAENLRAMARVMRDEGRGDTDTLLTMGILVGGLLHRQAAARQEFAGTFRSFDSTSHHHLFQTLFKSKKTEGAGP